MNLDTTRFLRDMSGRVNAPRVREDVSSGLRNGVNGTHTSLISGVRHDGPWDTETLPASFANSR